MGPSAALGACLERLPASVSLLLLPLLLCLLLFEALPLESLPCFDLDFLLFFSFRFESLPCFAFEDLPALLTPPLAFKLPLWPPSRASLSAASCALNSLQNRYRGLAAHMSCLAPWQGCMARRGGCANVNMCYFLSGTCTVAALSGRHESCCMHGTALHVGDVGLFGRRQHHGGQGGLARQAT